MEEQDDKEGITALGNARLGVTFIPTGKHMDGDRNWMINIGTIPMMRYIVIFREVPLENY